MPIKLEKYKNQTKLGEKEEHVINIELYETPEKKDFCEQIVNIKLYEIITILNEQGTVIGNAEEEFKPKEK